jgi:chloramphenicol 3-O phosphotransferase
MIVILNGASSSGKTTLARALQDRWEGPLVYLSLDQIIGMLPFAYTGMGPHAADGIPLFELAPDLTGFAFGRAGRVLNEQLATFAAGVASEGVDVVIDHILIDEETYAPFRARLDQRSTYLVGLRCSIDELLVREVARGDRMVGLARFQAARVHWLEGQYDVDVDTEANSPDVLAELVAAHVRGSPPALHDY